MDVSLDMSSKEPELSSYQRVTELFEGMMSELQINYLVSLEEKVSDMAETLALLSEENTSMEQMI